MVIKNNQTSTTTSTNQNPSFVYSISNKHNVIVINTPVENENGSLAD